jgi:hypothetical protein
MINFDDLCSTHFFKLQYRQLLIGHISDHNPEITLRRLARLPLEARSTQRNRTTGSAKPNRQHNET